MNGRVACWKFAVASICPFVAVCHVSSSLNHPQPQEVGVKQRTGDLEENGRSSHHSGRSTRGTESSVLFEPIVRGVAQRNAHAIPPYSLLPCASTMHPTAWAPAALCLDRGATAGVRKPCSMMPATMPFFTRLPSKRSGCSPPRSQSQTEDITIASQSRPSPHPSFPLHFDVVEARRCCEPTVELCRKPWFPHSNRVGSVPPRQGAERVH